jgi:hypothetical protein
MYILTVVNSKGKDHENAGKWVGHRDPKTYNLFDEDAETGQKLRKHYSVDSFTWEKNVMGTKKGFFQKFFRDNNDLVSAASFIDYQLEDYQRFYTLGMRAAMQISQKMLDTTLVEYSLIKSSMELKVLQEAEKYVMRKRSEAVDALCASTQIDELADGFAQLRAMKVEMRDTPEKPKTVYERVAQYVEDNPSDIAPHYAGVPTDCKAKYLQLLVYKNREGKQAITREISKDIVQATIDAGQHAQQFLDVILATCKHYRENNLDIPRELLSIEIPEQMRAVGSELTKTYLTVMQEIINTGLHPISCAPLREQAVSLVHTYGDGATSIVLRAPRTTDQTIPPLLEGVYRKAREYTQIKTEIEQYLGSYLPVLPNPANPLCVSSRSSTVCTSTEMIG